MRSLKEGREEGERKREGKEKFAYRVSLREARFQPTNERFTFGFVWKGGGGGECCNHVTHALQDEATGFDIGLKLYSNCSFLPKDFHGRILGGEIGNKNMIFQASLSMVFCKWRIKFILSWKRLTNVF